VVLPDSFFALDGLYETTFSVLRDFGVYPGVIRSELHRYLPFLATTALLMHAVRLGTGREEAHEIIKEHAVAAALQLREGNADGRELLVRLGDDARFPGETPELMSIAESAMDNLGTIEVQIETFCLNVEKLVKARTDTPYRGADIL